MSRTTPSSAIHSSAPHIRVRDLTVAYGSFVLMRGLNFDIGRGDIFIIMGGSGCGKSTLLKVLVGLKQPASGTVHYGDTDFWGGPPAVRDAVMRRAGILYQSGALWSSMTLAENVALPLEVRGLAPQHIGRRVRAVVRALGLENRLDTPGGELSGGEQQRVAVARSIVVNPQVLLADEPTGNLDPELSLRLMDIFMQFHAYGTTVVLATHSPELIRRHSDARLLRLEDGMITHANWAGGEVFRCADGGLHLGDGGDGGDGSRRGMDPCGLDAPGIPGGSAARQDDAGDSGERRDGRLSL